MTGIVFPNVANSLLPIMQLEMAQNRARREDEELAREREAAQYVGPALGGDKGAVTKIAALSPKVAMGLAPLLDRLDQNQRTRLKEAADFTTHAALGVLSAPPEQRPQAYAMALSEAKARGYDLSHLPQQYSPAVDGALQFYVGRARDVNKYLEEQGSQPFPVTPGAAPQGAAPGASAPATGDMLTRTKAAIAGNESGGQPNGGYAALGPVTASGDRAYGKYQVMGANIPSWTQEALGRPMTPQEFLSSPEAQEKVADHKLGQYVHKYGPEGAARAWFAGEGGMNNQGAKDVLGTSVADYSARFNKGFGASAGPQVAQAGGPAVIPQGDMNAPGMPGQPVSDVMADLKAMVPQLPPGSKYVPEKGKPGIPWIKDDRVLVQAPDGSRAWVPLPPKKQNEPKTLEERDRDTLLNGDPSSPAYAAAYAHLASPRVTLDQQSGQMIQVSPDMSWARKPTFTGHGQTASPDGQATGGKGVTVEAVPGMPGRMNNEQARDAGFADRMMNSNKILESVASQGGSVRGRFNEFLPGNVGNYLQSDAYQSFKQARDDFINAQLRRESGAAISADEYRKADTQYFPIPGDSEATIQQKAKNRQLAVDAMVRGAGPVYKPGPNVPTGNANKQGTYLGPDGSPINWNEIEATAKNRGITTDEVINRLGLKPAGGQ